MSDLLKDSKAQTRTSKKWTLDEDLALMTLRSQTPRLKRKEIAELISGRSVNTITHRVRYFEEHFETMEDLYAYHKVDFEDEVAQAARVAPFLPSADKEEVS